MREIFEFRISETDAARYLPPDLGVRVGIARKIEVTPTDPLFAEIGRIDGQLRQGGKGGLFTAWIAHRRYSRNELLRADLVRLKVTKIFEPAGEECGTRYDAASACPACGSGAQQVTPLFLDGRRIPLRTDLALTIAGELVASRRIVESWMSLGLRGPQFEPVRLSNKGGVASTDWFQLNVVSPAVDLDASSRVGRNPFNESTLDACPRGDLLAYSLLSVASIVAGTHDGSDVVRTRQLFGVRRGLLRPQPLILLSRRAWSAIDGSKLKGCEGEVAHRV